LKSREHGIVVEVFQDRLCDAYLDDLRDNIDADERIRQVELLVHDAYDQLNFFRAKSISSSMRQELRFNRQTNARFTAVPFMYEATHRGKYICVIKSQQSYDHRVSLGYDHETDKVVPSSENSVALISFVKNLVKGAIDVDVNGSTTLTAKRTSSIGSELRNLASGKKIRSSTN